METAAGREIRRAKVGEEMARQERQMVKEFLRVEGAKELRQCVASALHRRG